MAQSKKEMPDIVEKSAKTGTLDAIADRAMMHSLVLTRRKILPLKQKVASKTITSPPFSLGMELPDSAIIKITSRFS